MDRIRSAFNGLTRSEQYSRFTMQSGENGERHVEVKLSDNATDDDAEVEASGSPSFRPAPLHRSRRTVIFMVLVVLLIFVFGYLVGYISHRKPKEVPDCGTSMKSSTSATEAPRATSKAPLAPLPPLPEVLTWNDVTQLLEMKLTSQTFEKTLKDFDRPRRLAGSEEDKSLASGIFDTFKNLEMEPWTDIHYVQLQKPDSTRSNVIHFGSEVFKPEGYLAYSGTGKVEGRLVYGNYGRQEDLDFVQRNVDLKGSVLLLRAGKISFAQQVDNAAKSGAVAVLIYADQQDYITSTPLYGHVHMGSGDPYTPGFPSFNHTQFAPTNSSGLPKIPAQTINTNTAAAFLKEIGGPESDSNFKGQLPSVSYNLGGVKNITVEVNNVLVNSEIHNVFGVIKGFSDPDRYVVLGAQRDAWGSGYARATVGTSVLVELAKAFHQMVEEDGFRPRRSLVFASWSAGEYGSIGATEWLEGYMSSIDKSVFTYINLDGVVMGHGSFVASASPLLYSLIESTMKEVKMPLGSDLMYKMMGEKDWEKRVLRPILMDDPAYPFLAFSGIPSISFHFITENNEAYAYYGTNLDNKANLDFKTVKHTSEITATAAQFAGQMALRLVHDHLLYLDVSRYGGLLAKAVNQIYKRISQLSQSGQLKGVSPNWMSRARGSFQRAASKIDNAIVNTDLTDREACRILNDRMMSVEHCLLSPYVSPIETPFRHIILGQGSHTLTFITETTDMEQLRTQLALATWTVQGCANAMVGNIWDIDNEI